jgi:hypothetical protein
MRKWAVPLTVIGLGGLGALAFSRRGRQAVKWVVDQIPDAPEHLANFNEAAQSELDRIQDTLNEIAESLQTKTAR